MENEQQATSSRRWYTNPTAIALVSLILSVMSGVASFGGYLINRQDDREKRSIMEVDRLYDPQFAVSLSKVLSHAYGFIEDGKGGIRRNPKERFEEFWSSADVDADMLLIISRLASVERCVDSRDCNRDEVFSRFPETIYQAIFFLRDYVFVGPDLDSAAQDQSLEGWWFGNETYDFLANYCAWAKLKFGGMNFWSVKHERLARPGQSLPDPCLPRRPEAASD